MGSDVGLEKKKDNRDSDDRRSGCGILVKKVREGGIRNPLVVVPHCQEMGGNGSSVKILRPRDKTFEMLDNKRDKMKS